MNRQVSWVLELQVQEGRAGDLRSLMGEMVGGTRDNEPGTLDYQWSLSADGRQCHIYERYLDSDAVLTHLGTFGEKYAGRFLEILKPARFTIYGSPNAAVKEALAGLNPVYLNPADGFSR